MTRLTRVRDRRKHFSELLFPVIRLLQIRKVLKQFRIEMPLQSLFQSPTVAEMASSITEHRAKELSEHELQSILKDLESMSDEEAQGLLSVQGETKNEV